MTTTLNCFGWMQSQADQNPCTIAQEVGQLCNAQYTVSLTNFQESGYVPNATTANGCTCSWSIYNLLSACSFCVGQDQYTSWSTWITDCGSNASNSSYLPSGLRISQGIPFWAATNPSTWENAVFNLTQAADIAGEDYPDVTGGPLPTSTSSTAAASSASNVSVGAIVGGVIGAIAIIIIGGLIVFWAMRRRRRQRAHTTPTGVSSYNDYQPVTMLGPSIRHLNPVHPSTFWNTSGSPGPISPRITPSVRSATSIAATSLLVSPISSGFSSHGQNMAQPLTDAADMISPFLAMSPTRQMDRSNTSPPTSKAAEALSERAMAASAQRGRLNPPPYSAASVEPGSSEGASTGAERTSKKKEKKRNGSLSGMTTYSGHSRTSTKESATAVPAGPPTEASQPRAATPGVVTVESLQSVESGGGVGGDGGGGSVVMHGRASVSDQRPPAV